MANKRPAEQWYSGDWFRAVDVRKCSWATRGIWREMLDIMVNEQEAGKMRGTKDEICRLLGCTEEELDCFFVENNDHNFAHVTKRNRKVTIVCRRLYRQFLDREGVKKRVRGYRDRLKRKCNGDVTPYSSSSSSSSCTKSTYNTHKRARGIERNWTLDEVQNAAVLVGVSPERAEAFFHHYNAQDWIRSNGQQITDLNSALVNWKNNETRFEGSNGHKNSNNRTSRQPVHRPDGIGKTIAV